MHMNLNIDSCSKHVKSNILHCVAHPTDYISGCGGVKAQAFMPHLSAFRLTPFHLK